MKRIDDTRSEQAGHDGLERQRTRVRRLSASELRLGTMAVTLLLGVACGSYDQGTPSGAAGSPSQQPMAGAPGAGAPGAGAPGAGAPGAGGNGPPAAGGGGQLSAGAPGTAGQPTGGSGGAAGGGETKASCTNITACGGDAVGTWTVADSCLAISGVADIASFGLGCTEAPLTGMLSVTGTWTAMADGTYVDGTTTSGTATLEVAPACLNVSGTVTQCSRLGRALRGVGFATMDCVDNPATSGCTCTATAAQTGGLAFLSPDMRTEGRYTIEGGNVIAMSDPIETKYDYCVAANTMNLSVKTVSKAGTVTGSVLLTKP